MGRSPTLKSTWSLDALALAVVYKQSRILCSRRGGLSLLEWNGGRIFRFWMVGSYAHSYEFRYLEGLPVGLLIAKSGDESTVHGP
jgi:hypothetical protein